MGGELMTGWCGTVLDVNLTTGCITRCRLDRDLARLFLGGRGLNAWTLFDRVPPGADPLGPENVLCLAPGTLTATLLCLSSRLHVSTLSPYSGILGDGNAGGAFAHTLKRAGYDQIVVSGRAEAPVYLWIEDDRAALLPADDLWGTSVWDATDRLTDRHGNRTSVACIGQAGENLVRQASTMVDKYASAARGSGAVWGSKRLKAIVVHGSRPVTLHDRDRFVSLARADRKYLATDSVQQEVAAVYGSHYGMTHWFPGYRHFQSELPADAVPRALRPEAWKQYEVGRSGCRSCHIKCKNIYEIPGGRRKGERGEALEYEAIYCLGTNCGIEDPVAIMEMENLADLYGIDVIALGNTIALAKDLYHRGIITDALTDGLPLAWENADAQVELIHKTVLRQGFGNLIAEGLYSLARHIGRGAMDYCYHVKGLSRGPHPPGFYALAHAVSSRGADHLRGRSWSVGDNSPEEILTTLVDRRILTDDPVHSITAGQRATAIADAIGRCKGAVNSWVCAVPLIWKSALWDGLAELLEAATGIDFKREDIVDTADRIQAVERAFNVRQGITIAHDGLPQKPEVKESPEGEKQREAHFRMLRRYYRRHGYDPDTGIPLTETLERLKIPDVGTRIAADGPYPPWDGPPLWDLDAYPRGGTRV
ncbi:aldehyde ferredoxin oxidoreductase [Desulfosarcina alkanivorans]|uniref:Aldehyde ferredoxin oxidoreductase n=1 Tax=Desulfosarcina alkanivorans TaxID=571177 RepID=A0A5K7YJE4_9BACT|nr:aldehyde ferredoxin oxidoreductase family protein [Desulfosarcina alkanivorans]BBO66891.1 aldehyde ferredoxin oxidoreductase [Desulfosarcina alkanivorans]